MNYDKLEQDYLIRYDNILVTIASRLQVHLRERIEEMHHIDGLRVRAKSVNSFIEKSKKEKDGILRYSDPINQIYDQIGARIIVFYLSDIEIITHQILEYYSPVEIQKIIPDTPDKFGYEGMHLVLFIPDDILTKEINREQCPVFYELQIHTLFQHAWGEANHDLAYKAINELSIDQQRKVSFTAAQAWGADMIFNQLCSEIIVKQ